tara:strand:- start:1490 stop:1903 length:414 start_codon:yes stop_codon:yes gene_type:complete
VDFPTDITVLCLSCAKTMQPISCRIALQVDPAPAPMPHQMQQAEWLGAARMYFGLAARASPQTSIPEALTTVMQDDFVAERRANPDIGADDFARWLTMTRLLAGSMLEGEVSQEHYTRAKDLEVHRVARLKTASVTL